MKVLLDIQDLHVSFGPVKALNGLDLTLEEGEFLALVGESGCGKSVSALAMTRLLPIPPAKIERGKIFFDGREILNLPEKELQGIRGGQIAYIFQEPSTSLNPVFSIGDQIGEVLKFHRKMTGDRVQKEVVSLLRRVGLSDPERRLRSYPHELSGGMKQRVMIAMALACQPRLLIADEPTTALDVTIQAEILSLLLELKQEAGISLLFITHNLSLVSQVADSIAIMYCGKIVERGRTSEVLRFPLHPYTVGLIDCVPKGGLRKSEFPAIPGSLPKPTALPTGCHFHPRCAFKVETCEKEYPLAEEKRAGHSVRCFKAEEVLSSFQRRTG